MRIIKELILSQQPWLVQRVIHYAKLTGYLQYTSSQQLDWDEAVAGLSRSMVALIELEQPLSEFAPAMDFRLDPVTSFGIEEAQRHRSRGISIDMFFGLVKYFRRAYTDLIESQNYQADHLLAYRSFIIRFFDHVELGFIDCWTKQTQDDLMQELQAENRRLVRLKSRTESIFQAIPLPVILVSQAGEVLAHNLAAEPLISETAGEASAPARASQAWLAELQMKVQAQVLPGLERELSIPVKFANARYLAHCRRVNDLSGSEPGVLITLIPNGPGSA